MKQDEHRRRWACLAAPLLLLTAAVALGGGIPAGADGFVTEVGVYDDANNGKPSYWKSPETITEGDVIEWVSFGKAASEHSVTSLTGLFDSHPECTASPPPATPLEPKKSNPKCMQPGERFRVAFSEPGRYGYYCRVHDGNGGRPRMTGEIIVEARPTATTQPKPAPSGSGGSGSSTASPPPASATRTETITRTEIVYRDPPPAPSPVERERSDDDDETAVAAPTTTEWAPPYSGFSSDEVRRRATSTTSTSSLLDIDHTAAGRADDGEGTARSALIAGGLLMVMTAALIAEMRRRLALAAQAGYYAKRR